ncbi:S-methyl-5'-thioadenosine phosphorylase-like [Teleopsis dalmanni]|uniref:S-methyl-5'-thioadenosine phosphorylase-like n=1 Tax=Teleopsis dalmanni TaxID=139649 RepID=UPI000D32BB3F|nr:S-methyl-5'-thioadenosine phosphorylase-like [Teleopsis dalmanni]
MIRIKCGDSNLDPMPIKIGIIGGSGLDDPDILENRKETHITTPFGETSDALIEGEIAGVKCVLLARHGRKHDIMPTNVNYRANIWAMRNLNCTHVIVSTACGSLREDIRPGDLIAPHDFIDRTTKRAQTFYDGSENSPRGVCHLPVFPAFNDRTRKLLISTASELGYTVRDGGTVVAIEGPRYSSRAESNMYRQWGGDLVNMTICPEVVLAKEAGLLYASIAMATDYDCWRIGCESVNVEEVLKTFAENVVKIKKILTKAVENIAKEDWSEEIESANQCVCKNTMSADM